MNDHETYRRLSEGLHGYEADPAAEVLPLLEGEEFDALVADVRVHGLINPITLLKGRILAEGIATELVWRRTLSRASWNSPEATRSLSSSRST